MYTLPYNHYNALINSSVVQNIFVNKLLLIIAIASSYEEWAEWIPPAEQTGHICARAQHIPWESTHNIQWCGCGCGCVCVYAHARARSALSKAYQTALWVHYDTSQKRSTSLFPFFHQHTFKQRGSAVPSWSLAGFVLGLKLWADCFWIECGSGPVLSYVSQPTTCLIILSVSLWEEEQTVCSSRQIAHLKWFDISPHTSMLFLS